FRTMTSFEAVVALGKLLAWSLRAVPRRERRVRRCGESGGRPVVAASTGPPPRRAGSSAIRNGLGAPRASPPVWTFRLPSSRPRVLQQEGEPGRGLLREVDPCLLNEGVVRGNARQVLENCSAQDPDQFRLKALRDGDPV